MKPILYIDMDNVLVDFSTAISQLDDKTKIDFEGKLDEVPGIFSIMQPMHGAIEAVNKLAPHYEIYVLSTAPWLNPSAWSDKLMWIQHYFGKEKDSILYKKLIISHHKNLNKGSFLIDDREKNGAIDFEGELIRLGSEKFLNWESVLIYLIEP